MRALCGAGMLAFASLCLVGCTAGGTSKSTGHDVAVDLSAPEATVAAAPGDTITLRIVENRTTGYMWERRDPLPDGVAALTDTYVEDPQPAGEIMTGGGGTHVFTYRCDRATSGALMYKLYAPGDRINAVEERRAALTCH